MRYANIAWGDYDNDGDLDILAAGAKYIGAPFQNSMPATIVYRNDGNDIFNDIGATLTGIQQGSAAWGDYDNDGDLDIFLNGKAEASIGYDPVAQIFRNDGNDTFTLAAQLDSLDDPYGTWGDFDNDGFLDLVLTGNAGDLFNFTPQSILYRNDQNGGFIPDAFSLAGVSFGGAQFADYDNDNDLDLVLSGVGSSDYVATIYQNNDGVFQDIAPGFLGMNRSRTAWGDYDNDGDLDVIFGGQAGGVSATSAQMYRNDGAGQFTPITFSGDTLPPLGVPSFDWGDYDNDGDLDLLTTGQIGILATRYSAIFRNDGNDTFTAQTQSLVPVRTGDARWGDYDNDGDLDIMICGTDTTGGFGEYIFKLYRNELQSPNTAPAAPGGLNATVNRRTVTLSWSAASDAETPQTALSYNIRIGTAPWLSDVYSPMAAANDGFRKLPAIGNTNYNTSWRVRDLPDGIYYWAVQTIDGTLSGSAFSEEGTFAVGGVTGIEENASRPSRYQLYSNFPNPFNPETTIRYDLPEMAVISLKIYNAAGALVNTLLSERQQPAGSYQLKWDGRNLTGDILPSGIYFYRLAADQFTQTRKMILLK